MQRNFLIWLLASLFYAYQYILRVIPNIIIPELVVRFNIGTTEIGQFCGLYYVGYVLAHIPVGILLDRFGSKVVIPICIALTSLGALPLVSSNDWSYSIIGRIITGIGSSASVLGLFKIIRIYYHREKFAMMFSISVIIGISGGVFATKPLHVLLDKFGWDYLFTVCIMLGLLFALTTFISIPKVGTSDEELNIKNLSKVIFNKDILLIGLFGGFMIGPLEGFADAWSATFLHEMYAIDRHIAYSISKWILIGFGFGHLLLPYILAKNPTKHYEIIISCAMAMIIVFLLLFICNISELLACILLFIIGLASAYQIVFTAKVVSCVKNEAVASAGSVGNSIVMSFGYFFHVIIANIMNFYWNGEIIDGKPFYGTDVMVKSMLIIPICLLIGMIGFWLLKVISCKKS
ncbi:MFS transporter [Wolbachia endosymbiont (group A) of Acrocera orbiculus]|uniref:MFS transporter n=1 Tax=Wolbachia endosymbiont (group A) of Acrocera orbiculus TaxID=2953971 RepID=UPI002227C62B|nr:MFS transporter [Wolbachia endosymbiont (group A) of Acrocera orbiculus]